MTNIERIVEELSALTVMEAADLTKLLEEKWGVSAAAPMMSTAPIAAIVTEAAAEQTEFDVVLAAVGDKKIEVIKVVRAITGLGLKEAKDVVDGAPAPLKQAVSKADAEKIKTELEAVGAKVEIK